MYVHAWLIVRRGGEHLRFACGYRRVAFNKLGKHSAKRFYAERQRRYVQQKHVFDLAAEHAALYCRADCHALVGVDALVRLLSRIFFDRLHYSGYTRRTAYENNSVYIRGGNLRVLHRLLHGFERFLDQRLGQSVEFGSCQVNVKVLGSRRVRGDKGQVDVCLGRARQLDFGFFRRVFESLHCLLVFGQIYAVALFELVYKPIYNNVVEVVAAELRVAVCGQNLENAVAYFKYGNVERTAAQVVNQNFLIFVFALVQTVSKACRSRLVYDTEHFQPRNLARVLCRLSLTVREISGNGDYRLSHLLSQISLGVRFKL